MASSPQRAISSSARKSTEAAASPAAAGGGRPGGPSQLRQRPGVQQEGGGHAERHHVGQGVELKPELGRGVGEPRHFAIEDVQQDGSQNGDSRVRVPAVRRQQHRQESAEEVRGGQQARQQEDPPPALFPQALPPAPPRGPGALAADQPPSHLSTPMIVSPPRTLSPGRHRTALPRGMKRSVRDPKRISPKRPPPPSLSPGRTRHTTRRATTPAIWVTVTRADSPWRAIRNRSFSSEASGR